MTIKEAFTMMETVLPEAKHEVIWLLEKATEIPASQLRIKTDDFVIAPDAAQGFEQMLKRRQRHEPLQYILGQWEFMGLPMLCRPGVLIPRSDTELLATEAIRFLQNSAKNPVALDLCTGSGCVGIALAHFCPGARVCLSDIDPAALELARDNARLNGVYDSLDFIQSDLFTEINERFHCITANPPYIPTAEIQGLQEEVKMEPVLALDGGADGLDFYRAIIPECRKYLKAKGCLFLEVGAEQGKVVADMLRYHGFRAVAMIKDLEDRYRVLRGISI